MSGPSQTTPPPLPVAMPVALDYAMPEFQTRPARSLRVFLALAWAALAFTPPLMLLTSTEVIIGTGAAEAIFGLITALLARRPRKSLVLSIGIAHMVLAFAVFLWINVFGISPGGAHLPVLVIASFATLAFAWPTWRAYQSYVGEAITADRAFPGA